MNAMDGIFERNLGYWLSRQNVPESLTEALIPWQDRGLSLIDLGCGGGRLAGAVQGFSEVHAVDRSAALIAEATKQHPNVAFHVGDFQQRQTWDQLGSFDVIASNCAIRKDYCNLRSVAALCLEHVRCGLVLRIQGRGDLETVLPEQHRRNLFYDQEEIRRAFGAEITVEKYKQRFSSPEYMVKFLERIGVQHNKQVLDLTPTRCFYVLRLAIVI
jgi:protein-L-isoaspartate O-methyltransferase